MANHANNNDELNRAAARSSALLQARNSQRRAAADPDSDAQPVRGKHSAQRFDTQPARGAQPGTGAERRNRGESRRRGAEAHSSRGQGRATIDLLKHNSAHLLSVVAVVAIVVLMIVFIRACGPKESVPGEIEADVSVEAVETSPFNWRNLVRNNGRYAYVVDGQVKSRLGIDVSDNQHEIDWDEVAADGIDFAMIRLGYRGATEGGLFLDEYYEANLEGARAAGLDCGLYFFSQAISVEEAVEEADFVLENLNGAPLAYPIAFDSEEVAVEGQAPRTSELSVEEMTAIAEAFCQRVESAGYSAVIYGNRYDMARYSPEVLEARDIWWAEYDEIHPSTLMDLEMWQYTNGGLVAGISTIVDMNLDLSNVL